MRWIPVFVFLLAFDVAYAGRVSCTGQRGHYKVSISMSLSGFSSSGRRILKASQVSGRANVRYLGQQRSSFQLSSGYASIQQRSSSYYKLNVQGYSGGVFSFVDFTATAIRKGSRLTFKEYFRFFDGVTPISIPVNCNYSGRVPSVRR